MSIHMFSAMPKSANKLENVHQMTYNSCQCWKLPCLILTWFMKF